MTRIIEGEMEVTGGGEKIVEDSRQREKGQAWLYVIVQSPGTASSDDIS